jgi:hypothetical protein
VLAEAVLAEAVLAEAVLAEAVAGGSTVAVLRAPTPGPSLTNK